MIKTNYPHFYIGFLMAFVSIGQLIGGLILRNIIQDKRNHTYKVKKIYRKWHFICGMILWVGFKFQLMVKVQGMDQE